MSAAVKVRENIMQAGSQGISKAELLILMPEVHHRTTARAAQFLASRGFVAAAGLSYYPPPKFPTNYFLDQTLVIIAGSQKAWEEILPLAIQIPVAPAILRNALLVLEKFKLVELTEDHLYVRSLEAGKIRVKGSHQPRRAIKEWRPTQVVDSPII
jgi:hypothetical protein